MHTPQFRVSIVAGSDTDPFQRVVPLTDDRHHALSEYVADAVTAALNADDGIDSDRYAWLDAALDADDSSYDREVAESERALAYERAQLDAAQDSGNTNGIECQACGGPGYSWDPLNDFVVSDTAGSLTYHHQCGTDLGLTAS